MDERSVALLDEPEDADIQIDCGIQMSLQSLSPQINQILMLHSWFVIPPSFPGG
jgi:hypothetical protein